MCWFSILLTLGQVWSVINYEVLKCLQRLHKVQSLLKTLLLPEEDFEALCLLQKSYVLQVSMSDQCLRQICFLIFLRFPQVAHLDDRILIFLSRVCNLCYILLAFRIWNYHCYQMCIFFFQTYIWTSCKAEHHLKPIEWGTKQKSPKYIILFVLVVSGCNLNWLGALKHCQSSCVLVVWGRDTFSMKQRKKAKDGMIHTLLNLKIQWASLRK